ncbi:hypothetical protein PV08_08326 [Exophiala spinifera]|uniref:tRNA-splicing endonuclease subunit Sen15 domain-containing protein n=1 Tax=Exophiala spinifera TaxID=91928 RepID=A0A0D2BPU2_9EURO|nr:uncharacterized protein PV08_08326 [Exophiala spinifera]KIW13139.1 hypothetical protein PV08_08326 [Exophiala spinifera]
MATTKTQTQTQTQPPSPSALSTLISSAGARSATDSLPLEILHNLQHQHNWTDLKLHPVKIKVNVTDNANVTAKDNDNDTDNDSLSDTDMTISQGLGIVNIVPSSTSSSTPSASVSPSSSTPSRTKKPITATAPTAATTTTTTTINITLISGLPPRHSYVHPDLQNYLVKNKIEDSSLPVQREFVLPLSLNETWTLSRFCGVFDHLPDRDPVVVAADFNAVPPSSHDGNARPPQPQPPQSGRSGTGTTTANGTVPRTTGRSTTTAYEHRDQKRVLLGMRAKTGVGGDGTIVYYIMQEGEVKPRQNG